MTKLNPAAPTFQPFSSVPTPSRDTQWWHSITGEDPITLEPISSLRYPPFRLAPSTESTGGTWFDCVALGKYLVATATFVHPISRRVLRREEIARLDKHLSTHSLPACHVLSVWDNKEAEVRAAEAQAAQAAEVLSAISADSPTLSAVASAHWPVLPHTHHNTPSPRVRGGWVAFSQAIRSDTKCDPLRPALWSPEILALGQEHEGTVALVERAAREMVQGQRSRFTVLLGRQGRRECEVLLDCVARAWGLELAHIGHADSGTFELRKSSEVAHVPEPTLADAVAGQDRYLEFVAGCAQAVVVSGPPDAPLSFPAMLQTVAAALDCGPPPCVSLRQARVWPVPDSARAVIVFASPTIATAVKDTLRDIPTVAVWN